MKNVIVTGASGFIGRYLVKRLLMKKYIVYSVIRPNSPNKKYISAHENNHIIEATLEKLSVYDFPSVEYDAFFHLGWQGVNRDEINKDQIHHKNYLLSLKCLEIAKQLSCKCFLDTGSRAEYGNVNNILIEGEREEPQIAYAIEKLKFYKSAYADCDRCELQYIHFRLFSVIGVGDHPWSIISSACVNLKHGYKMKVGACQQLWNFMDVEDVAGAMVAVLEARDKIRENDNRIFNIASSDTRILREFLDEICVLVESKSEIIFDEQKKSNNVEPSIDKLIMLTNWKDQYTFAESIKKIVNSF